MGPLVKCRCSVCDAVWFEEFDELSLDINPYIYDVCPDCREGIDDALFDFEEDYEEVYEDV